MKIKNIIIVSSSLLMNGKKRKWPWDWRGWNLSEPDTKVLFDSVTNVSCLFYIYTGHDIFKFCRNKCATKADSNVADTLTSSWILVCVPDKYWSVIVLKELVHSYGHTTNPNRGVPFQSIFKYCASTHSESPVRPNVGSPLSKCRGRLQSTNFCV